MHVHLMSFPRPLAAIQQLARDVERAGFGREGKPLVFFSRRYWGLGSTVHQRE